MEHPKLVGLPLFLTMIFCFALVLANPNQQDRTSNARSAKAGTAPGAAAEKLAEKPQPKAKKKAPVASNTDSSKATVAQPPQSSQLKVAPGNGIAPTKTGTPQPNGPSPVQAAPQNSGKGLIRGTVNDVRKILY